METDYHRFFTLYGRESKVSILPFLRIHFFHGMPILVSWRSRDGNYTIEMEQKDRFLKNIGPECQTSSFSLVW